MGGGFFLLLTLAALTSAISLMEVVVSYLIDEWRLSRGWAVAAVAGLAFLCGVPSALSVADFPWLAQLPLVGQSFLGAMDFVFGKIALTVGALLLCLFVGWRWGADKAVAEFRQGSKSGWIARPWRWLVRYVCPLVIAAILIKLMADALSGAA